MSPAVCGQHITSSPLKEYITLDKQHFFSHSYNTLFTFSPLYFFSTAFLSKLRKRKIASSYIKSTCIWATGRSSEQQAEPSQTLRSQHKRSFSVYLTFHISDMIQQSPSQNKSQTVKAKKKKKNMDKPLEQSAVYSIRVELRHSTHRI